MNSSVSSQFRIGVDLGGTKIEAILIDREGKELFRERTSTPTGNYEGTIRAITGLVAAADKVAQSEATVGVGIPGTISPATGRVKNANSTVLIGHALDRDLAAAIGRSVRLANDADCFALSEAADGAGRDGDIVFGVILGTGVGGGLVVNKSIVRGPNAITGEWGHNPLPWPNTSELPGEACYCGLHGCIETFLSGPSLVRDHRKAGGDATDAVAVAARDPAAMDRYVDRLARGLASVINVVDPHVIVLGGGMSNITRLYRDVPALLPRYVFSDTVTTRIVPPQHGDSSGVRGAAWLWP